MVQLGLDSLHFKLVVPAGIVVVTRVVRTGSCVAQGIGVAVRLNPRVDPLRGSCSPVRPRDGLSGSASDAGSFFFFLFLRKTIY